MPTCKPVRKAIRTTSTANGVRVAAEGDEATAAAAMEPVHNPTMAVFDGSKSSDLLSPAKLYALVYDLAMKDWKTYPR